MIRVRVRVRVGVRVRVRVGVRPPPPPSPHQPTMTLQGVLTRRGAVGASRPAPPVRTVRGRLVRVARTYPAEAPGVITSVRVSLGGDLGQGVNPSPNPSPSPSPTPTPSPTPNVSAQRAAATREAEPAVRMLG